MKLNEAFFDYKPTPFFLTKTVGKDYEIFVNPSKKELSEFGAEGFRFIADAKKKKVYVFSPYILHQFAANEIYTGIELFDSPYLLAGTMHGRPPKVEDLVPFAEDAKEIFGKKFYKKFKEYDWSWVNTYFNIKELDKHLEGL